MKKALLLITLSIFLSSCEGSDKLILKSSTGRINSILVVVDNNDWESSVGKTLKDIFSVSIKGLPQPEVQFRVTQIKPDGFNSFFEGHRNILILGVAKKNAYKVIKNKYASPQIIMSIIGKNKTDLISQIKKHRSDILTVFKNGDIGLYQRKLNNNAWENGKFLALENIKIIIPKKYVEVENTKDFVWLRKYLPKDGKLNILAYSMPIQDNLTIENILNQRDSIGKHHIPGQFENTYMQTSKAFEASFKPYKINGITAYETRGLWEVKDDFMGGAFINYSFIDTKNNRILCLDGFIYAPNQDKRDYIFELEAIFKSLKYTK